MPSTPQSSHHAAHMLRVPTSFSTSVHGETSDSVTPPDLVMKRQQLAGLVAVHAADPSDAARAGMIAKLRFDIQRQERKRPWPTRLDPRLAFGPIEVLKPSSTNGLSSAPSLNRNVHLAHHKSYADPTRTVYGFATQQNCISNCISSRDNVRRQANWQHEHHQRHPGASDETGESWREARGVGQCQALERRGTAQGAGGARRSVRNSASR
eukprot:5412631-Pleurochrysis_carterae.AAC.1